MASKTFNAIECTEAAKYVQFDNDSRGKYGVGSGGTKNLVRRALTLLGERRKQGTRR